MNYEVTTICRYMIYAIYLLMLFWDIVRRWTRANKWWAKKSIDFVLKSHGVNTIKLIQL